jgi:hypothetical protein
MLETDSPYLTPRDMRPQPKARRQRDLPSCPHVAQAVAQGCSAWPPERVDEENHAQRNKRSSACDEHRSVSAADTPLGCRTSRRCSRRECFLSYGELV